jgi:hypothetical protein
MAFLNILAAFVVGHVLAQDPDSDDDLFTGIEEFEELHEAPAPTRATRVQAPRRQRPARAQRRSMPDLANVLRPSGERLGFPPPRPPWAARCPSTWAT